MWEALTEIINSSNGSTVVVVFLICVLIAFVLVKGGFLSVHTNAIRLGAIDNERNIIQLQQDYVKQHLKAEEKKLRKPKDYDKKLGQIIVQACYIEYCDWIAHNHFTTHEDYISLKQQQLIDVVSEWTEKEEFKSEEFIEFIKNDTKATIVQLINMREIYKGK